MKNKKTIAAAIIVILLCITTVVFQTDAHTGNAKGISSVGELPIQTIEASFVCDPYDVREKVGIVDYVFVGEVVERGETQYKDVVNVGGEDLGTPYTPYTINVISNIKGNLRLNDPIPMLKFGGVSQDGSCVFLYEDDMLPREGQKYIFLAFAQRDGSLLISGPNSNIPFENDASIYSNEGNVTANSLYDIYVNAYENEIVFEKERFVSVYEG